MTKPEISPDFTVDDIHKIREYHYDLTKDMSTVERTAFYKEGANTIRKEMEDRKKKQLASK